MSDRLEGEICQSCGAGRFEATGEMTKGWPEGDLRFGMECGNCGVVTWMPEEIV